MFHNRLHIYTVHVKPGGAQEDAQFVQEGFSWWAFLCGFLWVGYHRLWFPLALNIIFMMVIIGLAEAGYISYGTNLFLQVAQCVYIGYEGNEWLRRGLARRGYITMGVVSGENLQAAARRYFEQAQ